MSLDVYLYQSTKCPHCGGIVTENSERVYEANITHNLNRMAEEADLYKAIWRPEENGFAKASDIIEPIELGLQKLKANPEHYKKFDSPNGWGLYEHFVPFVANYLNACKQYPEAEISASR